MPLSGAQPNFKKKKKDDSEDEKKDLSRKKSEKNILPVAKEQIPKVQYIALEQENKKLKE